MTRRWQELKTPCNSVYSGINSVTTGICRLGVIIISTRVSLLIIRSAKLLIFYSLSDALGALYNKVPNHFINLVTGHIPKANL